MRQNELRVLDLKSGPSSSVLEQNGAGFDVQVRIQSGHGPGGVRSHVVGVILASINIVHACWYSSRHMQPTYPGSVLQYIATLNFSCMLDYGLQEQ